MKYFAYGSNMSISRLQERVPSAKRIGLYFLESHDLRFHKISKKDGSGKCDAYFIDRTDNIVLGTLFEINPDEKTNLDKAEGLGFGYNEKIQATESTKDKDTKRDARERAIHS